MEDFCEPCEHEGKQNYPTLYCLECREHYCYSCGRKHLAYKMSLTHTIKQVKKNEKIAGLDTATRSATKTMGIVSEITSQQEKLTPEKAVSVLKDVESPDYLSPYYKEQEDRIYDTITDLPADSSITSTCMTCGELTRLKETSLSAQSLNQQGKATPEKAVSVSKDAESSDYCSAYFSKQEDGIYEEITELPDDPSIASTEHIYEVTLSTSPPPLKKFRGTYRLRLTLDGIQLLDRSTSAEKLYWPLVSIRATGYAYRQNEFYIEGGRTCGNVQGLFLFKAQSAKDIHEAILKLCRAKQKLMK